MEERSRITPTEFKSLKQHLKNRRSAIVRTRRSDDGLFERRLAKKLYAFAFAQFRDRRRVADLLDVGLAVEQADALAGSAPGRARARSPRSSRPSRPSRRRPGRARRNRGCASSVALIALRIFALLVHADGAVGAVVDEDDEQVGAVLGGGRQLLPVHQEIAVAGDADHRPVLEAERGGDRGGQAVAHRARWSARAGSASGRSASSGATSPRNCRRRCR